MDGIKYESAVVIENANTLSDFLIDLVGCAEGECLLSIGSAAPENQVLSELAFEPASLSLSKSVSLALETEGSLTDSSRSTKSS